MLVTDPLPSLAEQVTWDLELSPVLVEEVLFPEVDSEEASEVEVDLQEDITVELDSEPPFKLVKERVFTFKV